MAGFALALPQFLEHPDGGSVFLQGLFGNRPHTRLAFAVEGGKHVPQRRALARSPDGLTGSSMGGSAGVCNWRFVSPGVDDAPLAFLEARESAEMGDEFALSRDRGGLQRDL